MMWITLNGVLYNIAQWKRIMLSGHLVYADIQGGALLTMDFRDDLEADRIYRSLKTLVSPRLSITVDLREGN